MDDFCNALRSFNVFIHFHTFSEPLGTPVFLIARAASQRGFAGKSLSFFVFGQVAPAELHAFLGRLRIGIADAWNQRDSNGEGLPGSTPEIVGAHPPLKQLEGRSRNKGCLILPGFFRAQSSGEAAVTKIVSEGSSHLQTCA